MTVVPYIIGWCFTQRGQVGILTFLALQPLIWPAEHPDCTVCTLLCFKHFHSQTAINPSINFCPFPLCSFVLLFFPIDHLFLFCNFIYLGRSQISPRSSSFRLRIVISLLGRPPRQGLQRECRNPAQHFEAQPCEQIFES